MANLIEFQLFAPYNKEAAVIGCFSDWQAIAMEKGDDGYFRTKVELKDGEYEYKFKVRSLSWFLESDEWVDIVDPYAANIVPETQNGSITIAFMITWWLIFAAIATIQKNLKTCWTLNALALWVQPMWLTI